VNSLQFPLPEKIDVDEPTMESWDGDLSSVEGLLERRMIVAKGNWFSTARMEGQHPYALKTNKKLASYSEVIINREIAAQEIFRAAIREQYENELRTAENSGIWDSSRRISKVENRFANSGIEGLPA